MTSQTRCSLEENHGNNPNTQSIDFDGWLQCLCATFTSLSDDKRNAVLDTLMDLSGPSQLLTLSKRIPQLVFRDFLTGLPPEISLLVLQHLSGKQLLLCCMVCKSWNKLISNISGLWRPLAEQAGADVLAYEERLIGSGSSKVSLVESTGPLLARVHKALYLQAKATLKGLSTGTSLKCNEQYIHKGSSRITRVKYHNGCIVTGCDDHTVQVWDVPEGAKLYSVRTNSVCSLVVRDSVLYTASFNANAESWDLVSGRHLRTFCGHTAAVLSIDVTADTTFMLTGSVDRTAKLWDLRPVNPILVRTISSIHQEWVFQVKFLPSLDSNVLQFLTCDSNLCNFWRMNLNGDLISSCHVNSDGSSTFTSFYHLPSDPYQMFACQWEEWSKSSWLTKYTIHSDKCSVERDLHVAVPIETIKAYILGAGRKFAVIMCSISRHDFYVMDLQSINVVSKISNMGDFCQLTRSGSTVCLGDTNWLDGFIFEDLTDDRPIFAASVGNKNSILLGMWACGVKKNNYLISDSEV